MPAMAANTGYVICGPQGKMKMWSPLGKKQEESNINVIKRQNFFLSFHSLCPDLLRWFILFAI